MNKNFLIVWALSFCGVFSYAYYKSASQLNFDLSQADTPHISKANNTPKAANPSPVYTAQINSLSVGNFKEALIKQGYHDNDYYGTLGHLNELAKSISFMSEQRLLEELEALQDDEHWRSNSLRQLLYKRWVELNPEAAMQHAMANPVKQDDWLFYRTYASWVKLNPKDAYSWYKEHENQAKSSMIRGYDIMNILTKYDFDLALTELKNIDIETQKQHFKSLSSSIHSRAQFDQLMALGKQYKMSPQQMDELVKQWASKNPIESMDWLMEQPSEQVEKQIPNLVGPWLRNDPQHTMDWIKTYQNDPKKTYDEILYQSRGWHVYPGDIITWLKKEPASAEREQAFAKLAREKAYDQNVVREVLEQIESKELQRETLKNTWRSLKGNHRNDQLEELKKLYGSPELEL